MTLDDALERLRNAAQTVPRPLRLPTPEEVLAAERELGLSFHPDFRRFQLEASNIVCNVLEPGVVVPGILPYRDLRQLARRGWAAGIPKNTLSFCGHNRNYFFIDSDGCIKYWDHADSTASTRYTSLADWIVDEWVGEAVED